MKRGCSLTLSDQVKCLADPNCHLCDPLEQPHCNDQIVRADDSPTTTQEPTESTSSSTESTPSSTMTTESSSSSPESSTTSSTTNSPETTQSTTEPSTTEEVPTTTDKPNSAFGLHASVLLIFAQLALCFYKPL